MALKLPVGQKRLTNIAIVRLKAHGKRFEIACYKNKVLNWREGIEKDLDEVLQTTTIFENVSKAIIAKEKDLQEAFGTKDLEEICKKILKTGELQVSDKEREVHLEVLFRDIVQIVVERCIHAQSGRQHTALTVESALRKIGFSVQPDHAAKKQALKAIESLCTELPDSFARAKMRLRIVCPARLYEDIRNHLIQAASAHVEEETSDATTESRTLVFRCDPRHYRDLDRLAAVTHAGEGIVLQIVTSAVVGEALDPQPVAAGVAFTVPTPPRPAESATPESAEGSAPSRSAMGGATTATNDASLASAGVAEQPQEQNVVASAPARRGMRCSSCAAEFADAGEYRAHCRSEWHNFNLKRKVKSLPPVGEEEFIEISLDVKEGFLGGD